MSNSCYEITKWFRLLGAEHSPDNLDHLAKNALDFPSHGEAKLRLNAMFDEAIEEVSHVPNLENEAVNQMVKDIRRFQMLALMAAPEISAKKYAERAQIRQAIHTLDLIGHVVTGTNTVRGTPLDRAAFTAKAQELMQEIQDSDMTDAVKAVLLLKFNAILRIMTECSGVSDDQIRRRLKSIFADISEEFERTNLANAGVIIKTKEWIKSTMRPGVFALGITADILAVAAIAGPDATNALQAPPEVRLIEGPSSAANDSSGDATSQK